MHKPEVRPADPKLKGWLSREDVQTAFASLLLKAYEATKPVAPDAVRKSIAEWAENDDLGDRRMIPRTFSPSPKFSPRSNMTAAPRARRSSDAR